MCAREELPAELKAFEAELAGLTPEDRRIDRARLLFAAGRASARRRANLAARLWAGAFGAMSVVAASLLAVVLFRPMPERVVERIVRVPAVDHVAQAKLAESDTKSRAPGPRRSDGPAGLALAQTDHPGILAARMHPYEMSREVSIVSAVLFGVPDRSAAPARRAGQLSGHFEWDVAEQNRPPRPRAKPGRSTTPKPRQPKPYRQMLEEFITSHG